RLGDEKETNLTIDQIITQTLGGVDVAAQKMRSPGDNILAELDMVLTQEQFISLYTPPSNETRTKRKAVKDPALRWANNEVPYKFASRHFDEKEQYMMRQAMTEWERYTCLRFRKATKTDRNVLLFQNGEGCNSQLGMVGGYQVLNLENPGCRYKGLYLHEVGHAIGLVHEHQLPTRDDYIKILYHNVEPQMRVWFNKYSPARVRTDNVEYEYSSVMHYGITAFSKDGSAKTIEAKFPSREEEIGRVFLKELAFSDVKAVNDMYNCGEFCPKTITCKDGGYVDQNCKCICPDGTSDCQEDSNRPQEKDDTCVNLFDDWPCNVWANYGECERNPQYMNLNCRKACRLCGVNYQRYEGTCSDVFPSDKCTSWKENGDCVTNRLWMKRNCKRACNFCDSKDDDLIKPEVNCNNTHEDEEECDKWALEAECNINKIWMPKNCRKSCRLCDADITPPKEDGDGDGDGDGKLSPLSQRSKRWSKGRNSFLNVVQYYRLQTFYTIIQITEEQKIFTTNLRECKNLYDSMQCAIWAEENECEKNPVWMKDNCAKACKQCKPDNKPQIWCINPHKSPQNKKILSISGSCSNSHNDIECKIWADSGHCEINPEWMTSHCRLSCRKCRDSPDTGTGVGTTLTPSGKL
ncbi:hypothetical protein LOTGIDRAFT_109273, partial [Lottia gigantea]